MTEASSLQRNIFLSNLYVMFIIFLN